MSVEERIEDLTREFLSNATEIKRMTDVQNLIKTELDLLFADNQLTADVNNYGKVEIVNRTTKTFNKDKVKNIVTDDEIFNSLFDTKQTSFIKISQNKGGE